MSAMNNVVRNRAIAPPPGESTAGGGKARKVLDKAFSFLKGVLVVGAVVYVTITLALQSVPRLN